MGKKRSKKKMTIEFGKNARNSFNFVDVFQNRQQ
eukprot:SAG11_NODE_42954_length_172_cov_149.191781_2_plen_33_part_01